MLMGCSPVTSTGTLKPLADSYIFMEVGSPFPTTSVPFRAPSSLYERRVPSSSTEARVERVWLHSGDISQWGSYNRGTNHRESP